MIDVLFLPMVALALFIGLLLLALSQDTQRRRIRYASLSPREKAQRRVPAAGILAGCLLLLIWYEGGGFGTLLWIGLISAAALAVSLLLAWRPSFFSIGSRSFS